MATASSSDERAEKYLAQLNESNNDIENLGRGLILPKLIVAKLYGYQKAGLLWLWDLHRMNKGGVLGDDMGVGKTIQVVVFLASLFSMKEISSALIVMPVSLIANWIKEFQKWACEIDVHDYRGATTQQREIILHVVRCKGGVVVVTYGVLAAGATLLSEAFIWDYVVLDEGHKIKNPTKCTKGAHAIPSRHRIVLTGTPIQNSLQELWSLFNFTHMGGLLGSLHTFKMEFETPIKRSREKGASMGEITLGNEMAVVLRKKIEPYFLRRTKTEVLAENKENNGAGDELRPTALERKNDFVVWILLSEKQKKLYCDSLHLYTERDVPTRRWSPLLEIKELKNICDHPRLLKAEACNALGFDLSQPTCVETGVNYNHVSEEDLLEESGKMMFLLRLLQTLSDNGHRSLVFSQSRRILDIVQRILKKQGIRNLRIDGRIKSSDDRQAIINKFSRSKKYAVLLLTSQVGGLGLTITAADRVIIYDPAWNPGMDSQVIDRCYRIGQEKKVIVYRLITCSTVEEKIYRRQVFKQSLQKQTTEGDVNPFRYFRNQELYELFALDDNSASTTQVQLERMHAMHRKTDTELDKHIAELYSLGIFGISDHDLMFSIAGNDDELVDEKDGQFVAKKEKEAETPAAMECKFKNLAIEAKPNISAELSTKASYSSAQEMWDDWS